MPGIPIIKAHDEDGQIRQIQQCTDPECVNQLAGPQIAKFVHIKFMRVLSAEARRILIEHKIGCSFDVAQTVKASE